MCSIMVLIIYFFVLPGNMPLTVKICLEILFNCQLLCLLIVNLMFPEHVCGISQIGERQIVIQCTAEAPPGAPNWASLCTCGPFAPRDWTLPFQLKWAAVGGVWIKSLRLLFCVNTHESPPRCLPAVPGVILRAIKRDRAGRQPGDGSYFGLLFTFLDSSQKEH